MPDQPTIAELVARARAGEQAAWDVIVERFAPLVWSICRRFRLSEVDAHDVGQNVWLRLVEHLGELRQPAALPGWIATTTRRECIRSQRATVRRDREQVEEHFDFVADDEVTQVDQWLLADERDRVLRAAFAQLPQRCRDLLALLLRDPPVAYAAISVELQMPIGAIGPTRARCLDRLRAIPELTAFIDSRTPATGLGG